MRPKHRCACAVPAERLLRSPESWPPAHSRPHPELWSPRSLAATLLLKAALGKVPPWPSLVPSRALAHVARAPPGPALAWLSTVTARQSPEPPALTPDATLRGTAGPHIGVKVLQGTSELGLCQTQGMSDAFPRFQVKREEWPGLDTRPLTLSSGSFLVYVPTFLVVLDQESISYHVNFPLTCSPFIQWSCVSPSRSL